MFPGYCLSKHFEQQIKAQFLADQKKAATQKTRAGVNPKTRSQPRAGGRRCG